MDTVLNMALPFYSSQPDPAGTGIYHSHPLCRVAQSVLPELRVAGTGEGRQQCPFCFLLREFQLNRELREQQLSRPKHNSGRRTPPDEAVVKASAQSLRQLQAQAGSTTWPKRH